MKTYRYKNISDLDLLIIGVGTIEAGAIVEVDQQLENPNLEEVKSKTVSKEDK